MKFATAICLACFVVAASAVKEDASRGVERKQHFEEHRSGEKKHVEEGRRRPFEEHRSREELGAKKERPEHKEEEEEVPFKMDERTKEALLKDKTASKAHVFVDSMVDYVLSNENRQFERECFDKFKPEDSIDFVIDIAPSPDQDKLDKLSAESPVAFYLDLRRQSPSQAYFTSIQMFIDAITYQMKPELTHSIIYDHGRKYYIRGKPIKEESVGEVAGEFSDKARNLYTMWPVATEEVISGFGFAQTKKLEKIITNNLGRMTKLALWNRDNGLPTVLRASRTSKPVYTFVITDGASGTNLKDLSEDWSRTTVIDIGNRRFAKTLGWEDMRRLVNVVTLTAPQQLPTMIDTCLFLVCKSYGCC